MHVQDSFVECRHLPTASRLAEPGVASLPRAAPDDADVCAQGGPRDILEERASVKRSAPSPSLSSLATPQEPGPAESSGPTLVQPWSLQDHAAAQVVAATYGVQPQDQTALDQWLERPVQTNKDVLTLVRSYHEKVIRPETYHLVLQLETALAKIGDDLFKCKQEFEWMAADNRQQQKHSCVLQIITSGWPQGLAPPQRLFMICWMLQQVPKVRTFLETRGFISDHIASEGPRWLNALSVEPVTVPNGREWFSGMTLLTFKAFDLRSAFLEKYDESTPITGKHIRVSPSSPQWQRKLEAPIRVLLQVLNKHQDHTGKSLTILWKTLTLMEPSSDRGFNGDAVAWARLFYAEVEGTFRGRLEITPPMNQAMKSPATEVRTDGENDPDLWTECWNDTMWGAQYDLDRAEAASYKEAANQTATTGKGINKGKGRKHWSQTMVHNDYFMPYPFVLDIVVCDHIAFCWDEYCQKSGNPGECVGDLGCSTYQGKPAVPNKADGAEDAEMEDTPTTFTATPPTTAASSTSKGGRGRGK